jgi:hypothetical protein
VPVVLLIAAVVVVIAIVFVATGHGGEMSYEQVDHAPLEMGPVSATDIVLLRPPTALWGYNMQVTDEALDRIATAIRDRDVLIVSLEQQIADLSGAAAAGRPPSASSAPPGEIAHEAARLAQEREAAEPVNGDSDSADAQDSADVSQPEPSAVSTNSRQGGQEAAEDD